MYQPPMAGRAAGALGRMPNPNMQPLPRTVPMQNAMAAAQSVASYGGHGMPLAPQLPNDPGQFQTWPRQPQNNMPQMPTGMNMMPDPGFARANPWGNQMRPQPQGLDPRMNMAQDAGFAAGNPFAQAMQPMQQQHSMPGDRLSQGLYRGPNGSIVRR